MIDREFLETLGFMAGAYVIAPILFAKFLCRANWPQVALAFPLFWLVLFLLLGFGRISEEVFAWTILAAMFVSWLGVPLMALMLKISRFPERLLSQR